MDAHAHSTASRSTSDTADRAKAAMNELLTRSATDLEFRRKLLSDPKLALAEFTGRDPSAAALDIAFVENKPGTATIVLPDPIDPAAELSESELEAVAGGSTIACVASLLWIAAEVIDIVRAD